MKAARPITAMIAALVGMIAWGLHFTLVYAIATMACLRPQSAAPAFDFRIVAAVMTAILISATAWCIHTFRKRGYQDEPWRFLNVLAVSLGLLAVIAVLWTTLPVFFVTDCRTQ
jgi:hypothetical protein